MNTEHQQRIREVEEWQNQNHRYALRHHQDIKHIDFLLSIVKGQEATPSDVDKLLFRLASQTCSHLEIGMRDCTDELPFADWCVVCQARGLLQKYERGTKREEEIATSMSSPVCRKGEVNAR